MIPSYAVRPLQVVVDASVLVAEFFEHERHHSDAVAFMSACRDNGPRIVLPAIAPAEVASAVRRNTGSPALGVRAVRTLRSMRETSVVSVEPRLGWRAAGLAATRGTKGCDAIYAALARHLGIWLVSLDSGHLALSDDRLTVLTPAQALARLETP